MLRGGNERYTKLKDEKKPDHSNNSYTKNSRGRYAQLFFALISLGAFATYMESGKQCGDDDDCADYVLSQVPAEFRAPILVFCGGGEFVVASTNCALDVIPQFLNYLDKYTGIQKYLVAIGLIIASLAASLELFFILLKAFDSTDEALADPFTLLAITANFPFVFYGIVNIASKDLPRLSSYIDYKRGVYKGSPIAEYKGKYEHLQEEFARFKSHTAVKYKALVLKAKNLVVDDKEPPLHFLYKAKLSEEQQEKKTASTCARSVAKGFFGVIGFASSIGSIVPAVKNTDNSLKDQFGVDDRQAAEIIGVAALSFVIGFPRIRAILGKTVMSSMHAADWSLSTDLDYQLYPKLTVSSWPFGAIIAYFSYAVIKLAALHNFKDQYRQPMAEFCAYAIEYSHLMFYFKLFSQLLSRFSSHSFLYAVQNVSKEVSGWTLEQFDDFRTSLGGENEYLLFGMRPFHAADAEEDKASPAVSETSEGREVGSEEKEVLRSLISDHPVVDVDFDTRLSSSTSSPSSAMPEERPVQRESVCSWLCAKFSSKRTEEATEQRGNLLRR